MKKNLWQSKIWEKFQNKLGRKTWFLKNEKAELLAIKFPLIWGYSWIDIPRGPIGAQADYLQLLQSLITEAQKTKTVFVRIMPDAGYELQTTICKNNYQLQTTDYKLQKAHSNHHPDTTLKLDLTLSEEELLEQMKPKGRYNLRLAQKKGVKIFESKDISAFFQLIQTTTHRNQFWGHSQNYYQTMLDSFGEQAQLLLAEYEGEIIAGGIFIYTEEEAIYYYGASSNHHRNVMAPYLLQWTAILEAKKRGCLSYDFLGIAPENSAKNHPWEGVTDFKKKFGGSIVNYSPAQEIVLKPTLYWLLLCAKKLKKLIH